MDQKTTAIEQDLKDIQNTRLALNEKLELLEQSVDEIAERVRHLAIDVIDRSTKTVVENMDSAVGWLGRYRWFAWGVMGIVVLGWQRKNIRVSLIRELPRIAIQTCFNHVKRRKT